MLRLESGRWDRRGVFEMTKDVTWKTASIPDAFDLLCLDGVVYRNCWNVETGAWQWMEQKVEHDNAYTK
jgi:hypothetical protein